MTNDIIDAKFSVVRARPRLIWADRVGLGILLIVNVLFGTIYALWGDPGTFAVCETIGVGLAIGVAFLLRVIDFIVTGRFRY